MKEPLISYDWKHELWHLMIEDEYNETTSTVSCQVKLNIPYMKKHVDWNPKKRPLAFGIPYSLTLLAHINEEDIKFGFDYVCKKCLKLDKINIKEFKVWLVIQKLKYL